MDFETFHQAYPHLLRWLIDEPAYRNAPRGHASREQLGVRYRLARADQRVAFVPARRVNIVFNFAESLWYLSGRDDLDFIAYYAPSISKYSADGRRLTGTAYGRALFGAADGRPDQWPLVVETLREDPDSKRAVIQIFRGEELAVLANPDVSCTLGLQFLLREGALHAVAFMRANDVYRGMTSDVFSFTFLQEMLARELGVPVGSYVHQVGSLHLYDPDHDRALEVLADPASGEAPPWEFPAMPTGDNWPWVREVLAVEERLRLGRHRFADDGTGVDALGLPPYWTQVVDLFEIHRRIRGKERVGEEQLSRLSPMYRRLVEERWPGAVSTPTPAAV
ncbi:thymidylate synthase [Streptomyces sp. SID3212]|uniref:thymidylate synthase n=1 Tax=unclassified Streptomyces TaxID=2593676 RepID=UPI00136D628F|nr:thymidylate synthase [Streptomyces sp. SID3212]